MAVDVIGHMGQHIAVFFVKRLKLSSYYIIIDIFYENLLLVFEYGSVQVFGSHIQQKLEFG